MAADEGIRVLVVDDHDVVHWGFRLLLSKQSWVSECKACGNSADALEMLGREHYDVALVDLFLGAESGAELSEAIRRQSPDTRVLLISGAGRISPRAAQAAGASGFISKDWSAAEVSSAVRMVSRGMTVFGDSPQPAPGMPDLSSRERDVLVQLATGATNREIAERLFLSPHTVKEYTSALYRKLEVRNRTEAVRKAEQLGLGG